MRLSKAERAEKNHREYEERKVNEFKTAIERERAKRLFTDAAAMSVLDAGDKSAAVLSDLVRAYKYARKDLRRELENLCENANNTIKRLDRDEHFYGTGIVQSRGSQIDMLSQKLSTLAEAIAGIAYAGGWRVIEIETQGERERRAERDRYSVEQWTSTSWQLKCDGSSAIIPGSDVPMSPCSTELACWQQFMLVMGGRL